MKGRIARFEARTMDEALEKIRSVFGEDGMILGTRTFRRGGVLGVGGRQVVEVFVADNRGRIASVRREALSRTREAPASRRVVERTPPSARDFEEISDTLSALREDIQGLLAQSADRPEYNHPFLKECYDLLILREVDPRVADCVVREIAKLKLPSGFPTPARVTAVVRTQLAKFFVPNPPVDPAVRPRVICLVGPTGVGKTTTIAKLAARAMINESKKVGLVTLDTFRIAAVDQLQKYAEIIGVPLRVVSEPSELAAAIDECRKEDIDLVFVDSAGRSHRDELKMVEITEFLSVVPSAEIHLVLSSTTHAGTIDSVAQRFAAVEYDRMVLTKVDETVAMGSLVAALLKVGKPISYITDGQNVPDDIMVGDPERIADLVLQSRAS